MSYRTNVKMATGNKTSTGRLSDGGDEVSLKVIQKECRQMRDDMHKLAKTEEIQDIIENAMQKLKREILTETRNMIEKKFKVVDEKIEGVMMETDFLKEQIKKKDDEIENLRSAMKVTQCDTNYNQQYSRKCNIRVIGMKETPDETADTLRDRFIKVCKEATKDSTVDDESERPVNLNKRDIVAIHRLPSKQKPRPLIIKLYNSESKSSVMRKKKTIRDKAGIRLYDDITKDNMDLIHRLNNHSDIEYAWYYNCAIYGKCKTTQMKVRFDLFDDIKEVIRKHIGNAKYQ